MLELKKEKTQIIIELADDLVVDVPLLAEIKHKAIEPIKEYVKTWEVNMKTRYKKNEGIRKTREN